MGIYKIDLSGAWSLENKKHLKQSVSATVPGTVHQDLLDNSIIEDPYDRDNENQLQWIGETEWVYTRKFTVSTELLAQKQIKLICEGLDTFATVTLNGKVLGKTDNMFRCWRFSVGEFLIQGENKLTIQFRSPVPMAEELQKKHPIPTWFFRGASHLRKEQCNFGWDWGPTLITCGIWKDIRLEAWSHDRLDDILVTQDHSKKNRVGVGISIKRESVSEPVVVQSRVLFQGAVIDETSVDLKRKRQSELNLTVKSPRLWWPNGMGEQPLYTVEVTLEDKDGNVLDSWSRRIGLRTLELQCERDQWGESFQFAANGVPFFAKGANWIPADTFAPRVSKDDYCRLIQDSAAVGMNMLRVWGGGLYEMDEFYDLCDEMGICVWQDFLFACATYPVFDKDFMENVRIEAEENVRRLRHHASLALWCGNNELEQGLVGEEWSDKTMSWNDYKKLFEKLLPDILKENDPQRSYWPGSPHTPLGDRIDFNNPDSGDSHLWDVWHGRKPFEWYRGCRHRFVSEFGFQSFPHPHTVNSYTEPGDRNITSYIMEHHQKCPIGNTVIMQYLLDWFRMPKDFESTIWLSQIIQGLGVQLLIDQLRRNHPRSMGALYWQLNDCWPVASWASIDYRGHWKALHFMAKRFYAPWHISTIPSEKNNQWEIIIDRDGYNKENGILRWYLIDLNGKTQAMGEKELSLPKASAKKACTVKIDRELSTFNPREVILFMELKVDGQIVARNAETFAKPKHLELYSTENVKLRIKKFKPGHFVVTLSTRKPVLFSWMTHELEEVKFMDNFIHLRPGDPQEIDVLTEKNMTIKQLTEGLKLQSLVDTYQ